VTLEEWIDTENCSELFRMENALAKVLTDTSEIDSELLDDKSEVLGVLAADNQGLCVLSQGEIEKNLSQVVSSLAKIAAQLEPNNENVPTIVLESQSKKLIVKDEEDVVVAILKKSSK